MGAPAIRDAGFSPWPPRLGDARATREGCGLPIDGAPRRVELLVQFLDLAAEPLPLRLRAPQILYRVPQVLPQPLDLPTLLVDDLLRVTRRRRIVALRHPPVMPDSCAQYKRNPLRLCVSAARDQCEGRVSAVLTR